MADLLVIVPTRGRPHNARRVLQAWDETGAWAEADVMFAVDGDDPEIRQYEAIGAERGGQVSLWGRPNWVPMVDKLNAAAAAVVTVYADQPWAIAFAGDDHIPRTHGWACRYLDELAELGTGIVYGDDLIQGGRLPTQWAMTADIVRALGRMVPAPVEHLYCDNAIMALGTEADCIRYLPNVVIEHCHPVAGTAQLDDQYRRVNAPDQYRRDQQAYRGWLADGLERDAAAVRALREGVTVGG